MYLTPEGFRHEVRRDFVNLLEFLKSCLERVNYRIVIEKESYDFYEIMKSVRRG